MAVGLGDFGGGADGAALRGGVGVGVVVCLDAGVEGGEVQVLAEGGDEEGCALGGEGFV